MGTNAALVRVPWNARFEPTDRCDRCGAQAYHRTTLPSCGDLQLLFCAHHGRENEMSLVEKHPDALVYFDLEALERVSTPNVQDRR
jgi:hypothetical protein